MLKLKKYKIGRFQNMLTRLALFLGIFFYAHSAVAQAPGTTCLGAVSLGSSFPVCTGAITNYAGVTYSGYASTCFTVPANVKREGWYSFTVSSGPQNITVTATSTNNSNIALQLFSACASGSSIAGACANAIATNTPQTESVTGVALATGTYYIRVVSQTALNLNFSLCINTTPANDDCAGAIALTPSGSCSAIPCTGAATASGTTAGATQTLAANCTGANTANDDVWYKFVATSTSQVITVTPSASFTPVIEVYNNGTTSCPVALANSVGCYSGVVGTVLSQRLNGLTVNGTYWVRVYDIGTAVPATTTFTICIQTPPANDDCAGAQLLLPGTTCSNTPGCDYLASNSGIATSATCPTNNPDDDVWYYFQATGTSHTVSVTGSASFDPSFEVFDVGVSNVCPVAANSINCTGSGGNLGLTVSSSFVTTVGHYYYFRVYDYGAGNGSAGTPATTTFTVCVLNPPPINDGCPGIALTSLTNICQLGFNQYSGDISGATVSQAPCTGASAGNDVWFNFTTTATVGQSYVVTVTASASFDPVFQVYQTACGGSLVPAASCVNNFGPGVTESVDLTTLTPSTQYWIRVYHNAMTTPATTTYTVCVTTPPLNDECSGAYVITPTNPCTNFGGGTQTNVVGATASGYAAPCGGSPNDDVWYTFTATAASHIITVAAGACATFDPVVQVYKNACGTGVTLACANLTGMGGTETIVLSGLIPGLQYWIRVYDFNGNNACANFNICITTPPVNDLCANAVTLTPNTSCITTPPGTQTLSGATQDFAANCGGVATGGDVWYTFNAATASQTITVAGNAPMNAVFELFSSNPCGGAGTSVGCVIAGSSGGTASQTFAGLIPAQLYWVRVYDFSGNTSATTFTICVVTPINNTCANAINVVCGGTYSGNTNIGIANGPAMCTSNVTMTPGLWYVYPGTGNNVTANLCGGTFYDSQIFAYSSTGPCTGLTCVAGDDDLNALCPSNGLASSISFGTVAGTNYYIYVCGYAGTGAFVMNFTCVAPPSNDQCSGAIPVQCGSTYTGSTVNASGIGDLTGCGAAVSTSQYPRALWYVYDGVDNFNTGDTTIVTASTCGSAAFSNGQTQIIEVFSVCNAGCFVPFLSGGTPLFTACCNGPFTCVAGADGNCSPGASVTFPTQFGCRYFIEVFGHYVTAFSGESYGAFTLNITGSEPYGTGGCAPLPVKLLNFTGQAEGKRNLLYWATATETNNDYFTIEKADDGYSFNPMARINGSGNSNHTLSYNAYDNYPNNGITYYRLRQNDYNGAYVYSNIISVNNNLNDVSVNNVRPNPTTDEINFDLFSTTNGNVHIQVMDYLGRIVLDETQAVSNGNSTMKTNMNTLPKGIYSLKVTSEQSGYVSVTKVVKN